MNTNESNEQPVVGLPGDERDTLISRVIDGVATGEDWATFRAAAAHDPSIWSELAETQNIHESICERVEHASVIADHIELPGGIIDDQPLRTRLELVSRWGGWAAAAAILLVWNFGNPSMLQSDKTSDSNTASIFGSGLLLNQAQPDEAFNQYVSSGQSTGQVIGEMPETIVIETRPMPDGTIEVLYLRQIIERQIIENAYREISDESGNMITVPVKLAPISGTSY